jgi:hypothetical protein
MKTDSKYPFAFDPVTGQHGFKKTRRTRLSDDEKKAIKAIEDRLKPQDGRLDNKKTATQTRTKTSTGTKGRGRAADQDLGPATRDALFVNQGIF